MKTVKERTDLDLLELVCELHSRSCMHPHNRNMHEAYVQARQELEKRILAYQNLVKPVVSGQLPPDEEREFTSLWNRQSIPMGSITKELTAVERERLAELYEKRTGGNFR